MEKSKSKIKYFYIALLISFILFLVLYLSKEAGYYEYKSYKKVMLTNEAIIKFEEDISLGKDVTINDYVTYENKDYSNKISNFGFSVGNIITGIMNGFVDKIVNILSRLFWD